MNIIFYNIKNIPEWINETNLESIIITISNYFKNLLNSKEVNLKIIKNENKEELNNKFISLIKILKNILPSLFWEDLSFSLSRDSKDIYFEILIKKGSNNKYKLIYWNKWYQIKKFNTKTSLLDSVSLEVDNPSYKTISNYFIKEYDSLLPKSSTEFNFKLTSNNNYWTDIKRVWYKYPQDLEDFSGLYSLTDKNKKDLIQGKEVKVDNEIYKIEKATKREVEIYSYNYFLNDSQIQFLLENEDYEVCTACSWSGRYCWRIASCCDWLWYVLKY